MTGELEYVRGHLEEALSTDGRVAGQGLDIVIEADAIVIRGSVATRARHDAIDVIAHEVVTGHAVRNETTVVPLDEPDDEEVVG